MSDSTHWQASLNEHRAAWMIACCCIATIFVASTWPELFDFEATSPVTESRQVKAQPPAQQQASSSTPEKRAPRTIKTEAASRETKPLISKKPRQQTPVKKPETIAASGNYYVQTGAFKEKIRAQKLASKLKEHGWNSVIVPKSGLHAVWAGPRNSREGIETLQKNIARTLNIKGFIIQKKNS